MSYTRKNHVTPRLVLADAYTIGSDLFQSMKARRKSTYYGVFRRQLGKINKDLYKFGDDRILFFGLQRKLDHLFYEPVTDAEIDITKDFLKDRKTTLLGPAQFLFPEAAWRLVVSKYNGYPPIEIKAMPEGSVVYPHEPIFQVRNLALGDELMGELAAWFESKLLQVWSDSERGTQDRHWYDQMRRMVRMVDPNMPDADVNILAAMMIHDFGDRSGMNYLESEDQGLVALYTFPGTDTFAGAFQAWMNNGCSLPIGVGTSVNALAHRNIQAADNEQDAYERLYEVSGNNEINSMVNDCYYSRRAVKEFQLPLALRSKELNNGKVVVSRPDSGDPLAEVLFIIEEAIKAGLYEKKMINGEEWTCGTLLRFIEGDGMTYSVMWQILLALIERKYVPWTWGIFGVGGGQRNSLKRDNLSAKYALCARGEDDEPVVKFSDTYGKTTLPGPFKVLRSTEALMNKRTIVHESEPGEDVMVVYYNGLLNEDRFQQGMMDTWEQIRDRSHVEFDNMPKTLWTDENHGYPASNMLLDIRRELLAKYAPDKQASDY